VRWQWESVNMWCSALLVFTFGAQKNKKILDFPRSADQIHDVARPQCQRRKNTATTSATAIAISASPKKGPVPASSQLGGRNQNHKPAPHRATALKPKDKYTSRWPPASMRGASVLSKAFRGSPKSTGKGHPPRKRLKPHLTKASMSLKAGCSQLRSHSNATISVVTSSAPAPARRS